MIPRGSRSAKSIGTSRRDCFGMSCGGSRGWRYWGFAGCCWAAGSGKDCVCVHHEGGQGESLPPSSGRNPADCEGETIVRLTVIGCGYVGLVTGACLAAAGHEVFCTDIDENRIDQLKAGKVPIYEEHLEDVLQRASKEKKIVYTSDAGEAIRAGEVIFICVGTPPKDSGAADLSAIDHVARQIAIEARSPKLVVEKSTVPALTGLQLQKALAAYSPTADIKFQ